MSSVKISELADAPAEGKGKRVDLEHPLTFYKYNLALFNAKGRYYVITDICKLCNGSLVRKELNGLYAACSKEDHLSNIKTGIYKFDRTLSVPIYSSSVEPDGIYINI